MFDFNVNQLNYFCKKIKMLEHEQIPFEKIFDEPGKMSDYLEGYQGGGEGRISKP